MSREEYISVCNCIDLLLDPPYFGSGVSFYESISTGTPTVTLKGKYLRSRFVSAAYRKLGLANPPVARSFNEYVDLCSKYYNDRHQLSELKSEINRVSSCLYDDLTMVRECEDLFSNALSNLSKS
jgi:predicted O-linked N-acetylglucosamine transferase (SPINDLY family)